MTNVQDRLAKLDAAVQAAALVLDEAKMSFALAELQRESNTIDRRQFRRAREALERAQLVSDVLREI